MHDQFITLAGRLNKQRQPYATAIIVNRRIPSSGKPGDKAIITHDGQIHGWIGGGCTRGIILKESLLSIRENKPRMVKITPEDVGKDDPNTKLYRMTCQSGGEVDVYIEPVLPKPHIVIFGKSHIAMALSRISVAMDYHVSVIHSGDADGMFDGVQEDMQLSDFSEEILDETSHIVICTQGFGDQEALAAALKTKVPYIAFVSSRKKAQSIFTELRMKGISIDELKKVKTPAGIDLNAKRPEEVAISILAEIIRELRKAESDASGGDDKANVEFNSDAYYLNPVCQIPIEKKTAKHILEYRGEAVYFCCDGCKVKFEADPEKYIPN